MTQATARRPLGLIVRDLNAAEVRLAELRRDPEFIITGGPIETEHRHTARRLAELRAEFADRTGS